MKRKIYAGLLIGGLLLGSGFSCLGTPPAAEGINGGTNGAPIWQLAGGNLLTNLQTVLANLTGG
jgi:hypothetical protein